SDPRYDMYLRVIQEIERKVDLIQYLPRFMHNILEFKVLFDAKNVELDFIYNEIDKILLDSFIQTASIERITQLENFLRMKGQGSLEQRRSFLLSIFQ